MRVFARPAPPLAGLGFALRRLRRRFGGVLLKDDYLKIIEEAGFEVRILSEDKDISKRQYQGIPLESLKVEAKK